jgi:hypothetical protein
MNDAEALRAAALSLRKNPAYQHPFLLGAVHFDWRRSELMLARRAATRAEPGF